jgi:enoyl-CoA hydratase/carnithine racemase
VGTSPQFGGKMPEVNDSVLYVLEGKVGKITLNRPEKRNALTMQ